MREPVPVKPHGVSPALRALFDTGQPLAIRCFAVLDGSIRGKIWTDSIDRPTWGAVLETAYDTLFLGGRPRGVDVHALIASLRAETGACLALWPDHEYNELLPPDPDEDVWELEFTDRPSGSELPSRVVAPDCELRPIDSAWFDLCRLRDNCVSFFGTAERALESGFGFCLVKDQQLLSEAFAAASSLGMIEIGTETGEGFRRRGYATICCAHLIRACEARGYKTYWNCAKDNPASAALARSMGYKTEMEFRYVVYDPPEA